ncbi:hypothetical protein Taro_023945 [Colocasia esculenta]|uniref:Uncharacterized protein n=1 Tax=Colocasia esculenta TaxID=4460 RepID=A0A843VCZ0_COLES|nr:hypothetical protein [Colocasia esculenta]
MKNPEIATGCSRRTGKKMSFLWSIHSSLATKNSSTRPQQVLKLVPRVLHYHLVVVVPPLLSHYRLSLNR